MIPITSLLRIRNEEELIKDTMEHLSEFSDEIFIFDDCSTDNSYNIAKEFPKVKGIIRNHFHSSIDQRYVQGAQRHLLFELAKKNSKNKWFLYADADERVEFHFKKLEQYDKENISAVFFKLFDSYLTKDDKKPYKKGQKLRNFRKHFGPEYREIAFLFRKDSARYNLLMAGQRQPDIVGEAIVDGYVQHYGKSLSVKAWEEKCIRYMTTMPELSEKWRQRQSKAIHELSDFKRKLLTWDEIKMGKDLVKI